MKKRILLRSKWLELENSISSIIGITLESTLKYDGKYYANSLRLVNLLIDRILELESETEELKSETEELKSEIKELKFEIEFKSDIESENRLNLTSELISKFSEGELNPSTIEELINYYLKD